VIKKAAGYFGLAVGLGALLLVLVAIFVPKIQLVENKTVEACIIPPDYLQKKGVLKPSKPPKEIIIKKIFIKSPQKIIIKKEVVKSPKKVIAKPPLGQCLQAARACKADKGCHAKGCVELSYYYRALRGFNK
jgi:hypothetical protein